LVTAHIFADLWKHRLLNPSKLLMSGHGKIFRGSLLPSSKNISITSVALRAIKFALFLPTACGASLLNFIERSSDPDPKGFKGIYADSPKWGRFSFLKSLDVSRIFLSEPQQVNIAKIFRFSYNFLNDIFARF